MSQPISFTVRPPTSAPYRPSPLGNGGSGSRGAPSRRLFEQNGHGEEDDDDDDDDDSYRGSRKSNKPKDERIDGFGNGKALGGEKPAGPLIIPALPNKDWRASSSSSSSSKVPSYRPETRDPNEKVEVHERTGDGPQRSGLRKLNDKTDYNDGYSNSNSTNNQVKIEPIEQNEQDDIKPDISKYDEQSQVKSEIKPQPQTLEEQALQAILMGEVKVESEEEKLRRELVIGGSSNTNTYQQQNGLSEEDAFKRDIDELPEESTAEDYAAIPVSAFGEAMARGMGWNPNLNQGTKIHEPKLRPALLGLGATALEKPLPPSRNGSSSSSKKQPKIHKKDSMKYNLGESIIKKERFIENGTNNSDAGGSLSSSITPNNINNNDSSRSSRRNSPEESDSSYSKRRRDGDYDDNRRERDSKRYETEEERSRRKAKEREREREREGEYETEEERAKRKAKERERRDRYDNERDRDRDRNDRYDRERRDNRDNRDRRDDRDRRNERDRRDRYDRDSERDSERDRDRRR
ncbi:uncharacterized protein L201_007306 [Kwoniella dendrophila CBS 6074]|uniref:Spp2/MOS2 G-patch domain-containing protein n=1 Tax=Kwoniella dendrophila CBS 6074 TaxID=1295534 RepID=A0AAX4K3Q7_9TREE